jgi:hypothetical protein
LSARRKGYLIALVVHQATRNPNRTAPVEHCQTPAISRKMGDDVFIVRTGDDKMKNVTQIVATPYKAQGIESCETDDNR